MGAEGTIRKCCTRTKQCAECNERIRVGEQYRDLGNGKRFHRSCYWRYYRRQPARQHSD